MLTPASPPSASGDEIVKLFVVEDTRYPYGNSGRAVEYTVNFTKMTLSHTMIVLSMCTEQVATVPRVVFDECKIRRYAANRWFTSEHIDADVYSEMSRADTLGYENPLVSALEEAWSNRVVNLILTE